MFGGSRLFLLIPVTLALLAAAQIGLANLRNELSLERQHLHSEQAAVRQDTSRLRLEVASLSRPERLRSYAINQLRMAPPTPMQVIRP